MQHTWESLIFCLRRGLNSHTNTRRQGKLSQSTVMCTLPCLQPQEMDDETLWRILLSLLTTTEPRDKLPQYNTVDDVVQLITEARNIVVLTGAGVSGREGGEGEGGREGGRGMGCTCLLLYMDIIYISSPLEHVSPICPRPKLFVSEPQSCC